LFTGNHILLFNWPGTSSSEQTQFSPSEYPAGADLGDQKVLIPGRKL
jgi:hypothetical protein